MGPYLFLLFMKWAIEQNSMSQDKPSGHLQYLFNLKELAYRIHTRFGNFTAGHLI